MKKLLTYLALCIATSNVLAAEVRVAVAANFRATLNQLAPSFEAASGHRLIISAGSTGKLYAQLTNGAPYDIFLAADSTRPALLEQSGLTLPDSKFTYAMGRLTLCGTGLEKNNIAGWLQSAEVRHIAIANPRHAPYGEAALEVLKGLNIGAAVNNKLVTGENISQTLQFLLSGNAEAAFIARSQQSAYSGPCTPIGRRPIVQQGVLMNAEPATLDFKAFLLSPDGAAIIVRNGYDVPLIKQSIQQNEP